MVKHKQPRRKYSESEIKRFEDRRTIKRNAQARNNMRKMFASGMDFLIAELEIELYSRKITPEFATDIEIFAGDLLKIIISETTVGTENRAVLERLYDTRPGVIPEWISDKNGLPKKVSTVSLEEGTRWLNSVYDTVYTMNE